MKNFFTVLIVFASLNLSAQTIAFTAIEVKAKPHTQKDVQDAFEKVFEGVEMNKGGVVLERFWNGRTNGMTHRIVFMYPLGEKLMEDEAIDPNKNEAFWAKMNNYLEEWGSGYSGRILSWKEGDTETNNSVHIWDLKVQDPKQFKLGHDKIVETFGEEFTDRVLGFGTYDIGRPNNASHWVVVTGKSRADLMMLYDKLQNSDEFMQLAKERGPAENVKDYELEILRRIQ